MFGKKNKPVPCQQRLSPQEASSGRVITGTTPEERVYGCPHNEPCPIHGAAAIGMAMNLNDELPPKAVEVSRVQDSINYEIPDPEVEDQEQLDAHYDAKMIEGLLKELLTSVNRIATALENLTEAYQIFDPPLDDEEPEHGEQDVPELR